MSDKIIACKDCKFFKRAFKGVCNKRSWTQTDYINGKTKKIRGLDQAETMRTIGYYCGSEAQWFESKAFGFFTRLFGRM